MVEADLPAFTALLDDVWGLKGQTLNAGAKSVWFRALQAFRLADVRAALGAHIRDPKRGQFLPMPADVIAQLQSFRDDDGRPGAEEAWAIAIRGTDEGETIVWTAETAEAMGVCRPILDGGDEVGARMAFKEAYARLVDEARRAGRAPDWSPSFGHDPERRARALTTAVQRGLLDAARYPMLSAPRAPVALLEHAGGHGIPEHAQRALLALREWLTTPAEIRSTDGDAKEATREAQRETQARVDRYTVPVPTTPPSHHWTDTDEETLQ